MIEGMALIHSFRAGVMLPKANTLFSFAPRIYGRWVYVNPAVLSVNTDSVEVSAVGGKLMNWIGGGLPIEHRDREITLVNLGRTLIPWANTALILTDGTMCALVGVSSFSRPRLLDALDKAGVEVHTIERSRRAIDPDALQSLIVHGT